MNSNKVGAILVRLGSIAILLSAVYYLVQNYSSYYVEGLSTRAKFGMFALSFILPVIIAAIIWKFPATVFGKVAPEAQDLEIKGMEAEGMMVIGTALLGLYVSVFGLLDVLYWESVSIWEKSLVDFYDSDPYQSSPGIVAARIASIAQVALGVALILGRKGIVHSILKIRGRATNSEPD